VLDFGGPANLADVEAPLVAALGRQFGLAPVEVAELPPVLSGVAWTP
jgi:hypothetical protein